MKYPYYSIITLLGFVYPVGRKVTMVEALIMDRVSNVARASSTIVHLDIESKSEESKLLAGPREFDAAVKEAVALVRGSTENPERLRYLRQLLIDTDRAWTQAQMIDGKLYKSKCGFVHISDPYDESRDPNILIERALLKALTFESYLQFQNTAKLNYLPYSDLEQEDGSIAGWVPRVFFPQDHSGRHSRPTE
ncbi:hypothetical protein A2Z00_01585 [Candidatus Gottesmanbacteria bacterium RBG_13_45_10]|uniref:Uncharacterized protein n=1 Tax=Candidatus Gottesmanbacteria bacterium RBG_13_45_10 TaxID=1798370 RepID=A0A1F5ZHS2_9BACT|nr:MAG: hypothetical protein A2Z00_01585 [Candidatus Gottesmanbacteria bacterium RBG_13_45_10]